MTDGINLPNYVLNASK